MSVSAPTLVIREPQGAQTSITENPVVKTNRGHVAAYIAKHPSTAFYPKKKTLDGSSNESRLNILDLHETLLIKILFQSSTPDIDDINNLRLTSKTFRDLSRKPEAGLKQYRILDKYEYICAQLKFDTVIIQPHQGIQIVYHLYAVDFQKREPINKKPSIKTFTKIFPVPGMPEILKSPSQENLMNSEKNALIALWYQVQSYEGKDGNIGVYPRVRYEICTFDNNSNSQKKILNAIDSFLKNQMMQTTKQQSTTVQDLKDTWKITPPSPFELILSLLFYAPVKPIKGTTTKVFDEKHPTNSNRTVLSSVKNIG